ncbi:UNVERIFIED_CONTAM: hypothetical protein Sradi_2346500 [Sesamum radiatum]|uniref:Reverse transcriptase zinc-binding domain-containing protein n=1 Tax=Sesamum radiatum TaxID=300843 RepID=A0AAW2T659_SESRA
MDSELQLVITVGEWSWPSARHMDIHEIVLKLPALHVGAPDRIIWKSSSGMFSTKDAYTLLSPSSQVVEWATRLHGPLHTPQHKFILWLAILGRLSTLDKPWCSASTQRCVLCDGQHFE